MLIVCLYDTVSGYQVQRLGILLSKWISKKVYMRFLLNKLFKIVWSVLKVEKKKRSISEKISSCINAFLIEIWSKFQTFFCK